MSQDQLSAMTRLTTPSRLDTFVPPRPSERWIRALVPVNRVLGLAGIPLLRRIPVLNWLAGIRGLADVVRIDFPDEDLARLRRVIRPASAAFITPNHPEFMTDWLLDKELSTRAAPLMASWATHEIVNGMGALMQGFWLKNNLIAQIPGAGGTAGKAYSVEWALAGHGVLLHPEGQVGWHGHTIGPLFPGVTDMALEALERTRKERTRFDVYICPVLWRLCFVVDVDGALQREMRYFERSLGLRPQPGADVAQRVHDAYLTLLERDESSAGVGRGSGGYAERQERLLAHLAARLRQFGAAGNADNGNDLAGECRALLRPAERLLRQPRPSSDSTALRATIRITRRLLRFTPNLYPEPTLTQEQVAENIKRLRADYCFGGLRDTLARSAPRPAGPRSVSIRVPEPIRLNDLVAVGDETSSDMRSTLLALLRMRMQENLDRLGEELRNAGGGRYYANPFLEPAEGSADAPLSRSSG
jgi:hypothetical protein